MAQFFKKGTLCWIALLALSTPNSASASNTNGFGFINNISATHSGALLFDVDLAFINTATRARKITSVRDAPPACAANRPNRWAIDASTPSGQTAVATLLWAAKRNKRVSVTGMGKCSIWPDTETAAQVDIQGSE